MSTPEQPPGGPASEPPVDEAELQRRLEEQLRRLRVEDLILESVASILNLSARRIAKEDERDLEQARVGIEAVRALLDLIEPNARAQVQEALSQVQVLYAREAQGGGEPPGGGAAPGGGGPSGRSGAGARRGAAGRAAGRPLDASRRLKARLRLHNASRPATVPAASRPGGDRPLHVSKKITPRTLRRT